MFGSPGDSNRQFAGEMVTIDGRDYLMPVTARAFEAVYSPTVDTNAVADGDILADFEAVTGMFSREGGSVLVQSIEVTDKDDQGVAFDLFYAQAAEDLGTPNSAPSVSDAGTVRMRRLCRVEADDYVDVGGAKLAAIDGVGALLGAGAATTSGFLAIVVRGGATFTAGGLVIRLQLFLV